MRLVLMAAAAMAAATSSAFAAPFPSHPDSSGTTVKYTFSGFCDGMTFHQKSNGTATGLHTGGCAGNTYAGGVRAQIGGKTVWIIMSTESDIASGTQMWVRNESALTWKVYDMANGTDKFDLAGSETLTVGAPGSPGVAPMERSDGTIVKQ